jgi:hypothetical protein
MVAYTVAVTSPGSGTPTGTVTLSDAGGDTCAGTVASGNCFFPAGSPGTVSITAVYAGDTNFTTSTSPAVQHTVDISPDFEGGPTSVSFTQGVAASYTIVSEGTPTPTMSYTGSLPAGLSLSSAGVFSGTPTQIGTYNINLDLTNGVPPDATETFTITVGKSGGTYMQPFNTGHGWTYTQLSCAGTLESCSNSATATSGCNPTPCVSATVGAIISGTQTGYFHNSYTWMALGVPKGATVLAVDGNFYASPSSCSGASAGMQIFDSTNAIEITSSPLENPFGVTAAGTFGNQGAKSVASNYALASTTVTLRFNLDPAVGAFATCVLSGDNYDLTITYIPANSHQVIVAKATIDHNGNIVKIEREIQGGK